MNLDPTTLVGGLSIGQKQMVEIARAISYRSKLIVMDEPTASLSHHEAETLMRMVKKLDGAEYRRRLYLAPAGRNL